MERKAYADKIMILGVDGMDPRLTRKYIDEGKMPSVKAIVERGCQRHDLVMLGSQPTVTPPQWTTLATGANPVVHGITQFSRIIPGLLTQHGYNLDSRMCKAEPAWNPIAESGKKTLVLHWPGSAWPPTSDSENLYVIDGSAPGSVASAAFHVDSEFMVGANENFKEVTIAHRDPNATSALCVIDKLPEGTKGEETMTDMGAALKQNNLMIDDTMAKMQAAGMETVNVLAFDTDGQAPRKGGMTTSMNTITSPIKPAEGWAAAPEGAKEFTILTSNGLIRRPSLVLKNENGIYDRIAVYKSKKDTTPLAVCYVGKMTYNVVDEVIFSDKPYVGSRHYKLISLAEDGSQLKMYVSSALDINDDSVIHPKRLHKAIIENVGPFPPQAAIYTQDEDLQAATRDVWDEVVDWYIRLIHYMVENEGIEVIFSHLHSVDLQEHTFIKFLSDKGFNIHDESVYAKWMEELYMQVEHYYSKLLHFLDEDWTMMITSDHAQVCPTYIPPYIGDMSGINVQLMEELGYTVLKRDENGNRIKKIDWEKTRAVASQGNDIFINLKGREPHGIVDPKDKYQLEEQIISDLYSYRHPDSGQRVIALALHNKDAVLLGYGGPTAGDVCFWVAEGYNYDHTDSLSTAYGDGSTSSSPIFIAAGKGLKQGVEVDRIIRQVDLAPTVCWLLGVRMPHQCEGAIVYQILEDEM